MLLRGGGDTAVSHRLPPLTCQHGRAVELRAGGDDARGPRAPPGPLGVSASPLAPSALPHPWGCEGEVGQAGGEPPSTAQTPIGVQCHPRGARTDR